MRKLVTAGAGVFVYRDRYSIVRFRAWVGLVFLVTTITLAAAGLTFGITEIVRSSGAASCHSFASTSGYSSAYHIQHFLDGGTCYVKLPNGHSLPEKMVTGFLKTK